MKILLDSSLPASLLQPNAEGVTFERVTEPIADVGLVAHAAQKGCAAVIVADAEILVQEGVFESLTDLGVALICSTAEQPRQTEANLLHELSTIVARVRAGPARAWWLGKRLRPVNPGEVHRPPAGV